MDLLIWDTGRQKEASHFKPATIGFANWDDNCHWQILSAVASWLIKLSLAPWAAWKWLCNVSSWLVLQQESCQWTWWLHLWYPAKRLRWKLHIPVKKNQHPHQLIHPCRGNEEWGKLRNSIQLVFVSKYVRLCSFPVQLGISTAVSRMLTFNFTQEHSGLDKCLNCLQTVWQFVFLALSVTCNVAVFPGLTLESTMLSLCTEMMPKTTNTRPKLQ